MQTGLKIGGVLLLGFGSTIAATLLLYSFAHSVSDDVKYLITAVWGWMVFYPMWALIGEIVRGKNAGIR